MALTVALNLAWAVIALAAVLLFALVERRHARAGRANRISATVLAVCFLFPCVSASDDILGLSTLRTGQKSAPAPSKQVMHLDRVLQELENLQVSAAFVFVFTLCCVGLVFTSQLRSVARPRPCFTGRGPPAAV